MTHVHSAIMEFTVILKINCTLFTMYFIWRYQVLIRQEQQPVVALQNFVRLGLDLTGITKKLSFHSPISKNTVIIRSFNSLKSLTSASLGSA